MSRQVLVVSADQPGGYATIGEALAAARSGAVIRVRPGRYTENLTVKTRGPPRAGGGAGPGGGGGAARGRRTTCGPSTTWARCWPVR
ncbi:hypothetical protein ACFQ7O_01625, partial [Streptomyces sp. NPDC056485]|uniref:hypothetical protein n=1 Tax=Streptomyces sp. NPDC056485 TaxID=3345834 RepID=UPI00369E6FEF